jgi:hypothetical protein
LGLYNFLFEVVALILYSSRILSIFSHIKDSLIGTQ